MQQQISLHGLRQNITAGLPAHFTEQRICIALALFFSAAREFAVAVSAAVSHEIPVTAPCNAAHSSPPENRRILRIIVQIQKQLLHGIHHSGVISPSVTVLPVFVSIMISISP